MPKILIVEDDEEIAILEKDYLETCGYEVIVKNNGESVPEMLFTGGYDLLILDLMLPGRSGYDICREIRDKIDIPILMVTAKTESIDKIRGLGLGADDYISKPFDPAELVARVKSHLKQYERLTAHAASDGNAEDTENVIQIGNLRILAKSWKVYRGNEEIKFPHREFELLKFLAMNPNMVFSKEYLFETIWKYDYVGDSATVTVHINRIREKIEEDSKNPLIIETVWGAGYRLNL
ncbi:response regulator transcription factor [Parasporobacterium paucivorans]|uniref:response regulator transcription factor n=1 Tax=Parasporobacterium paucivorans TaxID=115544 RepID=UPI0015C0C03A